MAMTDYAALTDEQRILDVLGVGGPRKINVLGGMLGSRQRAERAVRALRKEKLIRLVYRNGGPHYALPRRRK